MERIRSFVAIELPPKIRDGLSSLEERLKAGRHSFVKWVDPGSIHLTLKFLGNVDSTAVRAIVEAMNGVPKPLSPLSFQVEDLGVFPNWNRPQVIWVGIGGDTVKLASLQRDLENALLPLGFTPESRAFRPHLTLGRVREQATLKDRQAFGTWARSIKCENVLCFEVNALSLMKSQLSPAGAKYERLASVVLGVEPPGEAQ